MTLRRLESSVERKVVKDAKALGVKLLKFTPKGEAGWPDRIGLIPGGRPLFIEFKRPGEEPDALQCYRIEQLRGLGYDVVWCDSASAALACLAAAAKEQSVQSVNCETRSGARAKIRQTNRSM